MERIILIFMIDILCNCVFAQTTDNSIYNEIMYDTKCKTFVVKTDLLQSYKHLFPPTQLWNSKIPNYENLSSYLLKEEILHQINNFQNQNLYSSFYKPIILFSNNFYLSIDSLKPKRSSHIGHSPTPLFVAIGASVGGIVGASHGVSKNIGSGYILSNVLLGILIGSGAAYVLAAIFH